MAGLPLESLHIQRFRAFEDLRIERLGRVNLLVGKNSVGKTCVLEAIQLYARAGSADTIESLLTARDEIRVDDLRRTEELDKVDSADLRGLSRLFHGRMDTSLSELPEAITIGPVNRPMRSLKIGLNWYVNHPTSETREILPTPLFPELRTSDVVGSASLYFTTQLGSDPVIAYPVELVTRGRYSPSRYRSELRGVPCIFIKAAGLNNRQIGELYDESLTKAREEDVLNGLRLIAPTVERLNFVGERQRIPIVRIVETNLPVPLRSLGDGMYRMLGITAALASVNNGILLIDEIETGLHYSVQPDMWRFVFNLARKLDVQVFATTHSWDCIEAFQIASQEAESEGMLIRLLNADSNIEVTLFDRKQLNVITHRHLEVR